MGTTIWNSHKYGDRCHDFWANQPTDGHNEAVDNRRHYSDMAADFVRGMTMECSLKIDVKTTLRLQEVGLIFASH